MNSEELISYLTGIQRNAGRPVPILWENPDEEGDAFYPAEAYYSDGAVRIYRDIPHREMPDDEDEPDLDDLYREYAEDTEDWHDPANWGQNGGEGR